MKNDNSEESVPLCYQDVIPVEWELLKQPADAALQQHTRHDNIILLQGLLTVDEQPVIEHDEELSSLGQELQRIDRKMNLVLELLSQTLRSWRSLPMPVSVKLTTGNAEWTVDRELPVGEPILIRFYLSPVLPNPFIVTGKVQLCNKREGRNHALVLFDGLGGQVRDVLEKVIFRQHRRQIAIARQLNSERK